jgi:hypothetical protein
MPVETFRVLAYRHASCHECHWEASGVRAASKARRHAIETGHCPSLEELYDIHAARPTTPGTGDGE